MLITLGFYSIICVAYICVAHICSLRWVLFLGGGGNRVFQALNPLPAGSYRCLLQGHARQRRGHRSDKQSAFCASSTACTHAPRAAILSARARARKGSAPRYCRSSRGRGRSWSPWSAACCTRWHLISTSTFPIPSLGATLTRLSVRACGRVLFEMQQHMLLLRFSPRCRHCSSGRARWPLPAGS